MSYRKDPVKSFAEYQVGEGFGQAVNGGGPQDGKDLNTEASAKLLQKNVRTLPGGLQGYENYTPSQQFADTEVPAGFSGSGFEAANQGLNGSEAKPSGSFFQGFDDVGSLESVKDDAFAGYATERGVGALGEVESLNDEEDESALNFNGYGALADSPTESFHTYFHQASLANTEMELINLLAQAVKAVPNDAPDSLKKQYYDLAEDMLKKRKHGDLRHIDLQRVEIESNIGWLINPKLPKTGGFDALIKIAAGDVGGKLAQGEPDQEKMLKRLKMGNSLKENMKKFDANQAKPLSGFGQTSTNLTYVGLVLVGLAIVGAAYIFLKPKTPIISKKRKHRRK